MAGVRFSYPAQQSEPLFYMPRHTKWFATPGVIFLKSVIFCNVKYESKESSILLDPSQRLLK
jgi:hypothetical protein